MNTTQYFCSTLLFSSFPPDMPFLSHSRQLCTTKETSKDVRLRSSIPTVSPQKHKTPLAISLLSQAVPIRPICKTVPMISQSKKKRLRPLGRFPWTETREIKVLDVSSCRSSLLLLVRRRCLPHCFAFPKYHFCSSVCAPYKFHFVHVSGPQFHSGMSRAGSRCS